MYQITPVLTEIKTLVFTGIKFVLASLRADLGQELFKFCFILPFWTKIWICTLSLTHSKFYEKTERQLFYFICNTILNFSKMDSLSYLLHFTWEGALWKYFRITLAILIAVSLLPSLCTIVNAPIRCHCWSQRGSTAFIKDKILQNSECFYPIWQKTVMERC